MPAGIAADRRPALQRVHRGDGQSTGHALALVSGHVQGIVLHVVLEDPPHRVVHGNAALVGEHIAVEWNRGHGIVFDRQMAGEQ